MNLDDLVYPPDDYMKLLVLDPATAACGILALAVPGPPSGFTGQYAPSEIHVWAEAMLYNIKDADEAAEVIEKMTGKFLFETFIIDMKCGQQRPPGFPITIEEQFRRALEKRGVKCRRYGSGFEWGSPDVDARELLLKAWIASGMLKVHRNLTKLSAQMDNFFRRKTDPRKRDDRIEHDLIDGLEYCAAHFGGRLYWNEPQRAEVAPPDDDCVQILKFFRANDWQWPGTRKAPQAPSFGALGGRLP